MRNSSVAVLGALLLVIATPAGGEAAFDRDLARAKSGSVAAMVTVGEAYKSGKGATQNYTEAFRWLSAASANGSPKATRLLGEMHQNGEGVAKDRKEALRLFRAAAAKGEPRAMWWVGMEYLIGDAVPKDYAVAVRWYRQAAAKGDEEGINSLGVMYSLGNGVAKNKAEALRLFERAADKGSRSALWNMSDLYKKGEGIPVNIVASDGLIAAWKRDADPRKWRIYMNEPQPLASAGPAPARAEPVEPTYGTVDADFVEDYRRDALAGSEGAMWALATHHEVGMGGFRKDINEAAKWYRMLSDRGNARARQWLIDHGYPY